MSFCEPIWVLPMRFARSNGGSGMRKKLNGRSGLVPKVPECRLLISHGDLSRPEHPDGRMWRCSGRRRGERAMDGFGSDDEHV